MELEFFVVPGSDEEWHTTWVNARLNWWDEQGVNTDNIELYSVPNDALAHYSTATVAIMYRFPHGLDELEWIATRTDFDVGSHRPTQN